MTTDENTTTDSAYVPSEAEVEAILGKHRVAAFNGTQTACSCDRTWRTHAEWRTHLAAALVAAHTVAPTPPTDMVPAAALAEVRARAERAEALLALHRPDGGVGGEGAMCALCTPGFGTEDEGDPVPYPCPAELARTAPTTEGDPS